MDPIALLSLVVAAVALGASIIANQRSLAAAKASSDLALVSNMFNRRREAKFFEALAEIRRADFPQSHDTTKGFDGLPDETRANAFLVSGFFDDLGKLVAHRVVGEEIVIGSYGVTALWAWDALHPFIASQREINRSNFQIYFEYLVKRTRKRPPRSIYKELGILE